MAREAPGVSLAAAEKKLFEARELEAQADDDFWGGEVYGAISSWTLQGPPLFFCFYGSL